MCAVSPAFGTDNNSNLKNQSKLVQKEKNTEKVASQTKQKTWLNKMDMSALFNLFGWGGFAFTGVGLIYMKSKYGEEAMRKKVSKYIATANDAIKKAGELQTETENLRKQLNEKNNTNGQVDTLKEAVQDLLNNPPTKRLKQALIKLLVPHKEGKGTLNDLDYIIDIWVLFVQVTSEYKLWINGYGRLLTDLTWMVCGGEANKSYPKIVKQINSLESRLLENINDQRAYSQYENGKEHERLRVYANTLFKCLPTHEDQTVSEEEVDEVVRLTQYYGFGRTMYFSKKLQAWVRSDAEWEKDYRALINDKTGEPEGEV